MKYAKISVLLIVLAFMAGISYLSLLYGMKLVVNDISERKWTFNSGGSVSIVCPISISDLSESEFTVSKDQDFTISIEVLNDGKWLEEYKKNLSIFRKIYKENLDLPASTDWGEEKLFSHRILHKINPYTFIKKEKSIKWASLVDEYYYFKDLCPNLSLDECLAKFDRMADNTGGVCDASFDLNGDFKVHPKESVIEVELSPNEPKIISWVLTPQSAGYKIIQLEEGHTKRRSYEVIVTPIRFIPNWLAQYGALFFAFLGPVATLPWILGLLKNRKSKRRRFGGSI